jgi:hypothetical protein
MTPQKRNTTNSRYLSPQKAVLWLREERNFAIGLSTMYDLMRTHQIQSMEMPTRNAKVKSPRIRTTVAALEMYLEQRERDHAHKGRARQLARQEHQEAMLALDAAVIEKDADAELRNILQANRILTERELSLEQQAERKLNEALREQQKRAEKRAAKGGKP